ncbi:hypothetical protein I302_101522 [Kwoniella bestiolae CBS 10118]|uniref:Transcription initiation factor TFIID subunit 10 n=1 Tax=Kwoniella bestiolae CBS 10118 TaxID=1296100 RepID=A0A1B9GCG6_9TREE|nr:hypothetical protein I302_00206 [Kwoniella bestiolae CBS 10118]OCF28717.1 hypothetical protein I302_00206 [Kwoniella bestiolae CBS 10118]
MSDQPIPPTSPVQPTESAQPQPSSQPESSQTQPLPNGTLPFSNDNAEAGPSTSPRPDNPQMSEDIVMTNGDQPNGTMENDKDKADDAQDKVAARGEEEDTRPDLTELFAARRAEEMERRDRGLVDFLKMLDGYKPLIPEEVTEYYLQRSGFECSDPRLKRLLSLSVQKFISDLSRDAYQFAKLRVNGTNAGGRGRPNTGVDRNRVVLTMDDLSLALGEHGVNVRKPDYCEWGFPLTIFVPPP